MPLHRRRRAVGQGRFDRTEGAGFLAEPALNAVGRRHPDALPRKARDQPEKGSVGADEAAVGPSHEEADHEEGRSQDDHVDGARETEEGHEGIVLADDEGASRGREEDRRAEIDIGEESEPVLEPCGERHGMNEHQVLDRAEGTDGGAESTAEKEGEHQGQEEKDNHRGRDGVPLIGEGEGDVLDRADRADAPFAPEAEIKERENHQREDRSPPAMTEREERREAERDGEKPGIHEFPRTASRRGSRGMGQLVATLEIGRRKAFDVHTLSARKGEKGGEECGADGEGHARWSLPFNM